MNTLIIRHITGSDPASFELMRLSDGKRTAKPVEIPSPTGFPVEGCPNSELMSKLRWYLEKFLDYPFPPLTDVADRVWDSLRKWGTAAFEALFDSREGGKLLDDATRDGGYENLRLQISGDDPRILAWPWEALYDPKAGFFVHLCQTERRLNEPLDPPPLSHNLPRDQVNILLVTARPYEGDARYRSVSRLLVELIQDRNLPAQVHVLRPPTFDNLREHLRTYPNFYHILHFDGHGAYGRIPDPGESAGFTFQGKEGCLVFENEDGTENPVRAEVLSPLLRQHAVPAVVLNACQSGMIDEQARNVFASVASSLLQAGIRSVTAMAYSLYVTGAQVFLPAFYQRLFETGDAARAARFGRQQMFAHPERTCARGLFPLQDWLVPVIYQQDPPDFSFAAQASAKKAADESRLPEEARDEENPYGFIGRDGPLLELERAMRGNPAAILIHGLGGVGKTTLARGFLKWLNDTDGLKNPPFWFTFNDIRNAEFVFNRMGEAIFGGEFSLEKTHKKIESLCRMFRENPFVIVWDNFESARGIPGTSADAFLSDEDCGLLLKFLKKLRRGKTKVIITSRSEEDWLGTERRKIGVPGLDGEERWLYLDEIAGDLGIRIDRDDEALIKLMDMLNGHPLSMRVILPFLENQSPGALVSALESNLESLKSEGDETHARLYATLSFAENALPQDLKELLIPLSLHERFVHVNVLELMTKQADMEKTRDHIFRFCESLVKMGLLHGKGQGIYELHPAITGYLRCSVLKTASKNSRESWIRTFVEIMGIIASQVAPLELHEQRIPFYLFGASFHYAMKEAERLDMDTDFRRLLQALAAYTQNIRNFKRAEDLFHRLAEANKSSGDKKAEASAYHQLGMIAQEQRNFTTAGKWFRKSLEIKEKQGDEHGAASTYHQLGRIAEDQRDFGTAEECFRKSLEIKKKQGNEQGVATSYHHLGIIAEEQGEFEIAEKRYGKSLAIFKKQGNEHGTAQVYGQLGIWAHKQRKFEIAEKWYLKALAIFEKQGNEHGAASIYNQLGIIAGEQRDFVATEKWYLKALAIFEKQGNEHGAAKIYHNLGIIAQEQRDFGTAEKWYQKSLDIEEKQGNEHSAASTYRQLGILAGLQGRFEESGKWLIKCITAFARCNDPANAQQAAKIFMIFYNQADPAAQAKLKQMWGEAGLPLENK